VACYGSAWAWLMDATDHTLALATLRTCSFTALLAAILQTRGGLAGALAMSNTAFGIAAFVILWTTTWVSTRYAVRQIRARAESAVDAVGWTIVAGGFNGALLWCAIVLGLVVTLLVRVATGWARPSTLSALPVLTMLALPLGGVVAFAAGAVIGMFYGVLELMLDAASRHLWRLVADHTRASASGS